MIFKSNEDYEDQMKRRASIADPVNHPSHYTSHPAKCECGRGIECIQITEHMDFVIGNIVKYAWRAGLKDSSTRLEDLRKIEWYSKRAVQREIARLEKGQA